MDLINKQDVIKILDFLIRRMEGGEYMTKLDLIVARNQIRDMKPVKTEKGVAR